MDEEKFTQDMFGVSPPTFVTPDVEANAQLQIESLKNASIYYFVNFRRPHLLDPARDHLRLVQDHAVRAHAARLGDGDRQLRWAGARHRGLQDRDPQSVAGAEPLDAWVHVPPPVVLARTVSHRHRVQ